MADPIRVQHLIRKALAEKVAPAIAFGLASSNEVVLREWAGRTHPEGHPIAPSTIFDLASLTKPLTTTLWFSHLNAAGRIDLDTPIGDALPVRHARLAACPVWRLLTHTSGLPAHRSFYEGLGGAVVLSANRSAAHAAARRTVRRMIAASPLDAAPGEKEIYSDLGYLLLERICEAISAPLDNVWSDLPAHGQRALHLRPLPNGVDFDATRYAATEACTWRGHLIQGDVHDDNCWTMGGVGGHAGLFGTLDAVLNAAQAWLKAARGDGSALQLPDEWVPMSLAARWRHPLGGRVLGWDTPSPVGSTAGQHFGRRSFGHLGFTGTSIWIDPDADVAMVLLTNRVCPSRASTGIRWLRPQLHDAAWRCFT
jgi:CubicO group peptidase (beta-lactamase class C family)